MKQWWLACAVTLLLASIASAEWVDNGAGFLLFQPTGWSREKSDQGLVLLSADEEVEVLATVVPGGSLNAAMASGEKKLAELFPDGVLQGKIEKGPVGAVVYGTGKKDGQELHWGLRVVNQKGHGLALIAVASVTQWKAHKAEIASLLDQVQLPKETTRRQDPSRVELSP